MKKFIKDFTAEERDKICKYYTQKNGNCIGCPLHPLCKHNVFGALGFINGGNPNYNVIEVEDEILKQDKGE